MVGVLTATAPASGGAWSAPAVTTSPDGEPGSAPATSPRCWSPPARRSSCPAAPASAWSPIRASTRSPPRSACRTSSRACCIDQAQVVRDARSGATVAVYQSVIAGNDGVFTQALDPATGAPASPPVPLPGLGAAGGAGPSDPVLARTAAAARAGGGVYVAVPSGLALPDRTRLWRVGGGAARTARPRRRPPLRRRRWSRRPTRGCGWPGPRRATATPAWCCGARTRR